MKYLVFPLVILPLLLIACERPTETEIKDDGIPPAVPANVEIISSYDGEVQIAWMNNSDKDLKGYNIYRRTDSTSFELIEYVQDNIFFDDSLNYNTTYFYRISAVDIFNFESALSSEVFAKPLNKYRPYKPQNVEINARNWENNISVYLNWSSLYESDIYGYNIYRSENSPFTADSSSLISFTRNQYFSDTTGLAFYTQYYYKIKTVDKGELLSDESSEVSDMVLEIPVIVFPSDDSVVSRLDNFIFKSVDVPATYRIILQENHFYGEVWSRDINSSITSDTLKINFDYYYLYTQKPYYWRVLTFTSNNSNPNSVSRLYKFTIKQ